MIKAKIIYWNDESHPYKVGEILLSNWTEREIVQKISPQIEDDDVQINYGADLGYEDVKITNTFISMIGESGAILVVKM